MDKPNETIANIVREMREMKCHSYADVAMHADFCGYADRIEAAAKRDKDAAEAEALNVGGIVEATRHRSGDSAAIREALEEQLRYWNAHIRTRAEEEMRKRAEAALSAPPRNCDVYDAENGVAECMQAIDAAWHEIDTIRATIGWMLAPAKGKEESNG